MIRLAVLLLATVYAWGLEEGWFSLFDGTTLTGWTPNENPASFRIEDGRLVADGDRSHLFYTGPVGQAQFTDCEFRAEVFVHKGGSSAVYLCAANLGPGWAVKGLPVKLTNTRVAETASGGIYYIPETYRKESPVGDGQWFDLHIIILGKRVQVLIDDKLVTDYTETDASLKPFQRKNLSIGPGTFALQCHGKGQRVDYRNIRVKPAKP